MALAIVGEAFLSASVEVLLKKIVSPEFVNFFRSKKLDDSLLKKLKTTLLSLQAVLNDAEEKQITNPAVKEWLDELRDAVFEADDLFDEISTEALRCKAEAEYPSETVSGKAWNIPSSFIQSYEEVNSKMQILFDKLQIFAQQIRLLGLKVGVPSSVWHGNPTSSVVDESGIYGRDGDRKILKDYLLSEDVSSSDSKIGVISIVGMAGIGKTTLAKLLYNDLEVKEKFDLIAWAYISKDFDICRVTKTLLESVTSKTVDNNNLNSLRLDSFNSKRTDASNLNTLQVQLQQSLSHKKFLLVLDDIWEREGSYVDWNNLRDIFNAGETGSRIIITTRDKSVALAMQTFLPIHNLEGLENEDCWSLFAKHAFGPSNYGERSNLEVIGKEIAKKCGGLPLAAVALGGLLRIKSSQRDWKEVLESNIWDLPNVQVQPALLLSYHYLPSALKQCFSYCSIFPKNSMLEKKMVVQLWIAEGLVHQSKSKKIMEEVGDGYFDELVSRSLIHRRSVDGEARFEMHDLINDLATMVSSPYSIRLDEEKPHGSVRHLSYNRGKYDSFNKFDALYGSKGLRTFLPLPLQEPWGWSINCYLSSKVIDDMLLGMKQLRVLSLSNYRNVELSDSIGKLIYLRYLNLSNTDIERLPFATCKLYNLQTLLLFNCRNLTKLPEDMGKLVNLRHLDISGTGLREIPVQIATLQNLQSLSDFIVSKHDDGLKLAELSKFPHLQGKLSISKLQNVTDRMDACQANLKMKEQIDSLVLEWDDPTAADDSEFERLVLEQLRPSTNLKKLSIINYGGTKFPDWLGDSSFRNMVHLVIWDCAHCSWLPPLGQLPKLKQLSIVGMKSVKIVGGEFCGSNSPSFQLFRSLEILSFREMPEWEEWNLSGGTVTEFPSLRSLSLMLCPKLNRNIPGSSFPSLTELMLHEYHPPMSRHSDVFSQLVLPFNILRELSIYGFSSLTSFPRDGLPKTLQYLFLWCCPNLEFLPRESLHNYKSLEHLTIYDSCDSMESFTLGSLPVLKSLCFEGCRKLKSILNAEDASQSLSLLRSISIRHCDELESFSPSGLSTPNLIHFDVSRCEKLKSLPEPVNTLAGLQTLRITHLPNLQYFAKEGLPTNLRELEVICLGGISWKWNTTVTEWRLEHLTCLLQLQIGGDDIVNALMKIEVPLLPTSLKSLEITFVQNIECLDEKWLQHLTSLQNLTISYSFNLKSLPKDGLPSSLKVLKIRGCLSLHVSQWIEKEWPKIAHVPTKIINSRVIIS